MPTKNYKTFIPSEEVKQRITNWEGAPAQSDLQSDCYEYKYL